MISQLVRSSVVRLALGSAQRILATGEAGESEVQRIVELVVDESEHRYLLVGASGERGGMHWVLSALTAVDQSLRKLAENLLPEARAQFAALKTGQQMRAMHARYLLEMSHRVEIAGRPLREQQRLADESDNAHGRVHDVFLPQTRHRFGFA